MKPVCLRCALHNKEAATFQYKRHGFFGAFVFEGKLAFRTKTERRNNAVPSQCFFVVAVPRHSLATIVVEIQQTGIERSFSKTLRNRLQFQKLFCPRESFFGDVGVRVRIVFVAIPRHFALGDNVSAKDYGFVIFPDNALEQRLVIGLRCLQREYRSVINCLAIVRQEIKRFMVRKQVHGLLSKFAFQR